jgi:hypothetical protein
MGCPEGWGLGEAQVGPAGAGGPERESAEAETEAYGTAPAGPEMASEIEIASAWGYLDRLLDPRGAPVAPLAPVAVPRTPATEFAVDLGKEERINRITNTLQDATNLCIEQGRRLSLLDGRPSSMEPTDGDSADAIER